MRWQQEVLLAAWAAGWAVLVIAAIPVRNEDIAFDPSSCEQHLHRLVLALSDAVPLDAEVPSIDWKANRSVILHYENFSQLMWCEDGVLQVRIGPPVR